MSVLPVGISGEAQYQISRSLRFNSADSAYLNRTPSSAGNQKTWTWSGWIKKTTVGNANRTGVIGCLHDSSSATKEFSVYFNTNDTLRIANETYTPGVGWSYPLELITSQVFRDVSSYYHLIMSADTTQATASNRFKVYINGQQVTSFSTAVYIAQNTDLWINASGKPQVLGVTYNSGGLYHYANAYLTEVNFIDGQALTPSAFGETDPITGVWKPKKYTGTYGTNGFYLNFSDNSGTTATTLGKDYSGNGNNWTPNNFSVTAGAGNDSLVDVPTLWGSDTGAGGEVRGNYATWNAISIGAGATLANGNLDVSYGSGGTTCTTATFGMSSGKWYWEVTVTASSTSPCNAMMGITNVSSASATGPYVGANANGWGYFGLNGNKYTNGSGVAYGASFTTNDVIGFAFDADVGTITAYKNGVSQGTMFSSLATGIYYPAIGDGSVGPTYSAAANFGQRPFSFSAPSGFKALVTTNLP